MCIQYLQLPFLRYYHHGYDRFTSTGGIEVLCSDLSRTLGLDEVLVDLLRLGGHLDGVLGLLEVLTGHPELNVLLTELGLQEGTESVHTICETGTREGEGEKRETGRERRMTTGERKKGRKRDRGEKDRKRERDRRREEEEDRMTTGEEDRKGGRETGRKTKGGRETGEKEAERETGRDRKGGRETGEKERHAERQEGSDEEGDRQTLGEPK